MIEREREGEREIEREGERGIAWATGSNNLIFYK